MRSLLPAAARESAFFSPELWFALGLQLPLLPACLPGTRSNPGQHAGPEPVERFSFTSDCFFDEAFADVFFAALLFAGVFFAELFLAVDFFAEDLLAVLRGVFFAVAMVA